MNLRRVPARFICGSVLCIVGIESCSLSLNPTGEDPSYRPPGITEGPEIIPGMTTPLPTGAPGNGGVPAPVASGPAAQSTGPDATVPVVSATPTPAASTVEGEPTGASGVPTQAPAMPSSAASASPASSSAASVPVVPADSMGQSADAGVGADAASLDAGTDSADTLSE